MLKTYLKTYGYLLGLILISLIILSVINYFINIKSFIIKIVLPLISLLVSSIYLGKNSKESAYLEGLKFASSYLILTSIFKVIFKTAFSFKVVIMYLVIIFTCVIGSMIGINIKKS